MLVENVILQYLQELGIFMLAIWATTELIGGAFPKISNKLIALILGFVYGLGAHFSGLLSGSWFEIIFMKAPIAAVAAQIFHDRIYNVFKHSSQQIADTITSTTTRGATPPDKE